MLLISRQKHQVDKVPTGTSDVHMRIYLDLHIHVYIPYALPSR